MNAQQIGVEVVNCFTRVMVSNFQLQHATPAERVKLATSRVPLTDPLVQNYAVWRKSILWIAAITLFISFLVHTIGFTTMATAMSEGVVEAQAAAQPEEWKRLSSAEQKTMYRDARNEIESRFSKSNLEVLDGLSIFILVSQGIGTILVLMAAIFWHHLPLSKRLSRIGWAVMFITPFLLALLPVTSMLDWSKVDAAFRAEARAAIGTVMGLAFMVLLAPKAISLFAGGIRSAITLKTLLPESAAPGWAASLIAPLYALFLVVMLSFVIQLQGNVWLLLGMIFLTLAPLTYLAFAGKLLQPLTDQNMTPAVTKVRVIASVLNAVGLIFILVFVITIDAFDIWEFLKFMVSLVGAFMVLTVVASDFFLALIFRGYEQSRRFAGTPWQATLEKKFDALAAVGATRMGSSFVPSAQPAPAGMPSLPPAPAPAAPVAAAVAPPLPPRPVAPRPPAQRPSAADVLPTLNIEAYERPGEKTMEIMPTPELLPDEPKPPGS